MSFSGKTGSADYGGREFWTEFEHTIFSPVQRITVIYTVRIHDVL